MPVNIPDGLDVNVHFGDIKGFLERILVELRDAGTGARRVVSRLNRTDKAQASPVFVGVVEDVQIIDLRKQQGIPDGDVGKMRFKDENESKVYEQTVKNAAGAIVQRHWNGASGEKTPGAKQMGKGANCLHQRFIAIRIPVANNKNQHVGTITVGFGQNPNNPQMTKVKAIMEKWAQSAQSEYVNHLKNTFNLNGPTHP